MPDPVTRLNAALEGRYRIERELGEGGMATVYLARDEKHNRSVALKVLKPELAAVVGAERFLSEIETTANLQHPHILPLFDSGEANGFLFYVMPFVEGETLRDRLDREHQLPVEEAVSIAKAVAQALRHAHDRGVIHRDIKPGNILIQDGQPVVSDFGIALAVGTAGAARLTETGLSVGTPYYMSPEQATGDVAVGPATDVYALGCVLYEMLIGDPPYIGSTAQAVLGKIIQGAPVSATGVRKSVPANVDAAIRRALEKLPADRFASAQDFAKALLDEHFRHGDAAAVGGVGGAPPAPLWRRALPWAVAAAFAVLALVQALRPGATHTVGVVRFTIPFQAEDSAAEPGPRLWRSAVREVALSPDGEVLVYWAGGDNGSGRLYLRRLDQDRPLPIPGTEWGHLPTFSPDGAWIAFHSLDPARGASNPPLMRVSLVDGRVETIASSPSDDPPGMTWGDDGTIVVNADQALYRVPASGGEWETIAEAVIEEGEAQRYGEPTMLPGSRALLFHIRRSMDPANSEVAALDLATGAMKSVIADAMAPTYVPTGHLLFVRQATLMAVRFDLERLEAVGQPVAVTEDVMQALYMSNTGVETGAAQVAVSANGHLVYAKGGVAPEQARSVVRITPAGDTVPLGLDGRRYGGLRVSPDGTRLAMTISRGAVQSDLWIHDLVRGVTERMNTGSFTNWPLEWSPDGQSIVFTASIDQEVANLYRIPIDGSEAPERLAASPDGQSVASVSIDGAIAYRSNGDLWVLPPDGDPQPFVTSEGVEERYGVFSTDGRWLAYVSDRTGRSEAYIRPYPGPGSPVLLTSGGATNLAWSRDGRRLYYLAPRDGPDVLMSVEIDLDDSVVVGTPRVEVETFTQTTTPTRSYDLLEDGSIITSIYDDDGPADGASELHVVLNFFDELRERLPN